MNLFGQSRDQRFAAPAREEWLGMGKWLLAYAGLFSLLSLAHAWLRPDYGWVFPAKLVTLATLLWFAARRGHHALVLGLCGGLYLLHDFPAFGLWFLATCGLCWSLLHYGGRLGPWGFWTVLLLSTLVLPKALPHLLPAGLWREAGWWQEAAAAGLLLRYAYYHAEWREARWEKPAFLEHLAYLAFVPQLQTNLHFAPSTQWSSGPSYPAACVNGVRLLGWCFLKIAAWHALDRLGPSSPGTGAAAAWFFVLTLYVKWFCWFSAHLDLALAFARFLGINLPGNFRLPLLAASPIEHWRRWNIFARSLLVRLVYLPLGGPSRARRNILLTFLASALVLYSGWWGSDRLLPDFTHLLHWTAFALAGAGLVLANHEWRRRRGLPRDHRPSGWRWAAGWIATQSAMAWLHLIILGLPRTAMPGDALWTASDRLRIVLRGLGLD